MLPDADAEVDIDDLTDDDDDDDLEEIDVEDQITDDEEDQHPTRSSSSSPELTHATDGETSGTDTAAAADTSDSSTKVVLPAASASASDEDNINTSETTGLIESQVGIDELQLNELLQAQPTTNADGVTQDADTVDDVDDELAATPDELGEHTDNETRQAGAEETVGDQSPENSSAENQEVTCIDDDDDSQLQCQSETTETDDVIASASAAVASTVSLSTQQPQLAEDVDASQQDSQTTPRNSHEDEQNDEKFTAIGDEPQTEQRENTAADQNEQKDDFQATSQSQTTESGREPDSTTVQTEENLPTAEEQEQTVDHIETATELETQPSRSTGADVTSEQGGEVGHGEVSGSKVTEEVKVTYEASAKQLDLLSRLAMLRERAEQRKAQQTTSSTDSERSQPGDVTGRPTAGETDQQPDQTRMTFDVGGTSEETNNDREDHDQKIGEDAGQTSEKNTGSPSHDTEATTDASQRQIQLISRTHEGHSRSHVDTVETEVEARSGDSSTPGHISSSLMDKPAIDHELGQTPPSDVLSVALETAIRSDLNDTVLSTEGSAVETESTPRVLNGDRQKLADQLSSATVMDSGAEGLPDQSGGPADDTVDNNISGVTTTTSLDGQSEPVHHDSEKITMSPDKDKNTDSGPTAATTADISASADHQYTTTEKTIDPAVPTTSAEMSSVSSKSTESSEDSDTAVNYDSDLDAEFADSEAVVRLLADIVELKSNSAADGPGYLYVFTDRPNRRFKIGASRSPATRLRQAAAFNPDIMSLISVPVSRRAAAASELRRRLAGRDVIATCLPGSRDWFTATDDVMKDLVRQVFAGQTDN